MVSKQYVIGIRPNRPAPPISGSWVRFRGTESPAEVRGGHSDRFNLREPATQTDFVQKLRGPLVNQAGAESYVVDPEAP